MVVFEVLFWVFFFLVIYPYALYGPLLKRLVARKKAMPLDCYAEKWPKATFIISAYNEEKIIAEKLDNTLALQYPEDGLEIIVVSDASSDDTDTIVRKKSGVDKRIRLIRQEERKGKTSGINLALEAARGEIIVFTDANAIYREDALYELIKYFKNPGWDTWSGCHIQ